MYKKKLEKIRTLLDLVVIELNPLIVELSRADTGDLDLGDLGSELGTRLSTMSPEEATTFIDGLKHGISLNNGTH